MKTNETTSTTTTSSSNSTSSERRCSSSVNNINARTTPSSSCDNSSCVGRKSTTTPVVVKKEHKDTKHKLKIRINKVPPPVHHRVVSSEQQQQQHDNNKKSNSTTTIHNLFEFQQLLGEGSFGKVYQAVRRRDNMVVALKVMWKPQQQPPSSSSSLVENNNNNNNNSPNNDNNILQDDDLEREIDALTNLSNPGHKHVCKLYDHYIDNSSHCYLSMEYVGGKELFEHLFSNGPFSEQDASMLLKQVSDGLNYIHNKKGYVHADLKPENLMIMGYNTSTSTSSNKEQQQRPQPQVKIVDFGFSVQPYTTTTKPFVFGTWAYLPPECMLEFFKPQIPTFAVDMYAVGVILYTVLTGTHPFDPTNQASDQIISQHIYKSSVDSNYLDRYVFDERVKTNTNDNDHLSTSSMILIKSLLHPNPNQRMTSKRLCDHPWILGTTASPNLLPKTHSTKLKQFWQKRFRNAILNKFGIMLNNNNNNNNSNNNGLNDTTTTTCSTTTTTAQQQHYHYHHHHHHHHGGRLLLLKMDELQFIFNSIDLNGDGKVTLDELKRALQDLLGIQNMLEILDSVDANDNGSIDFDEFQTIMMQQQKPFHDDNNNNDDDDDDHQTEKNNAHHDNTDDLLHITNEKVRVCILEKFGGGIMDTDTTTTTTVADPNNNNNHNNNNNNLTREMLQKIFDTMDLNHDGTVQLSEVIEVLKETPGIDEDAISIWADKTDSDLNGDIDFEEFCSAMMGESLDNFDFDV